MISTSPETPAYGRRLIISAIETRARAESESSWVSIPIDDHDLTKGYKEITYGQFANSINHAAVWLRDNLPSSSNQFPAFAYIGPKDLRYAFFAAAAGKLSLVMVLPSPTVTPAAKDRILAQKNCTVFVHASEMAGAAQEVTQVNSNIRSIIAPELDDLLSDVPAEVIPYNKLWDEAKDDPWLVFHTSGTTGFPKAITHSQSMMTGIDYLQGLEDDDGVSLHAFAHGRWFVPMPLLHYVGMFIMLAATTFLGQVPVLGPASIPPGPAVIKSILKTTHVDGAILVPALIDALCRDPEALELLRKLKYIFYAGAPLSTHTGKLLTPQVRVAPGIGSTEAGGYFTKLNNIEEDWDYISFHPLTGAVFEPRVDNMYELVFIRQEDCSLQPIFIGNPTLNRFETKDLWIEHPTKKGQWKIVGRTDDYVFLANGDGLYVSPLEQDLESHPKIRSAVIGGQSRPKPVILIELVPEAQEDANTPEFLESLQPYIDAINEKCHEYVKLDPKLVIFTSEEKPFPRTIKDTVARILALKLYEDEIEALYRKVTVLSGVESDR